MVKILCNMNKMKSTHQEECSICYRDNIRIHAYGECDHPVCYQCSARMRVLCETLKCPKCRFDMSLVVFTSQVDSFVNVCDMFSLSNETYKIKFENSSIEESFDELLQNKCKKCDEIFQDFQKLAEHTRRQHELHYCELCTDTLKLFSGERKCYSRKDLGRHKRIGDPDEKSHIGHPLCEFCDRRYFDKDELYRHLRREHFFCHFCDADGKHQYYCDYDELRVHFRKDHYLCEEDNCANEKFTSVFRTEIDLKAHVAVHHSKNKSKAEVKKTRTLDFDFNYAPISIGNSSPRGGRHTQHRRRNVDENVVRNSEQPNSQTDVENIDTQSVQDFPYLSEDVPHTITGAQKVPDRIMKSLTKQTYTKNIPIQYRKNVMSAEDFPVLGSSKTCMNSDIPLKNDLSSTDHAAVLSSKVPSAICNSFRKKPSPSNSKTLESSEKSNSKWDNTKKEPPKFDEEFPKLESKKVDKKPTPLFLPPTPKVQAPLVKDFSSIATSTKSEIKVDPTTGETFLLVKNKNKKKKSNIALISEENSHEPIMPKEDAPNIFKGNNKDFKKHLLDEPSRSPYQPNNDIWTEKFSLAKSDFPPLAPAKPPGLTVVKKCDPPPGFFSQVKDEKPKTESKRNTISLSAIAQLINKQEQPNGQSESPFDSPNNYLSEYVQQTAYLHLPDELERNGYLKDKIGKLVNIKSSKYNEFKMASGKFRYSDLSAIDYHSECLKIFGLKGFLDIFPELLVLLPDISKQQMLLKAHDNFLNYANIGSIGEEARTTRKCIVVCELCNQVLTVNDCGNHKINHKERI